MAFLGEIKRRKVFKVAAVYAVVAWLIIQVVGQISGPLGLPVWFDAFVIVLLGIGFPIALILGWIFDLTPEGLRSTPSIPGESVRPAAGQRFSHVMQALVLLAVGFLVIDQYVLNEDEIAQRPVVTGSASPDEISYFPLTIPADQPIENSRWNVFAFSPAGRRFVYQSNAGLYVRDFGSPDSRFIEGSENLFGNPFLSPDGQHVAFYSLSGNLVRVPVDGGEARDVSPPILGIDGAYWTEDDFIIYATDDGDISIVPADGGEPELLVRGRNGFNQTNPVLLPDGDTVIFSRKTRGEGWDDGEIIAHSRSSGAEKVLVTGGSDARYLETGHLVFESGGRLYGMAFDTETLSVSGDRIELAVGLRRSLAVGSANYGVSRDGTLAFASRFTEQSSTLVWLDRNGIEESIVGVTPGDYRYVQLSPDDSMAALNGFEGSNTRRIWIHDLVRSRTQQLLTNQPQATVAIWSGNRVAYSANRSVFLQRVDGVGSPEEIFRAPDNIGGVPSAISPDGQTLFVMSAPPPRSVWSVEIGDPDVAATPVLENEFSEYNATISPDGKWIAYQSNELGKLDVYVRAFSNESEGKWQVSQDGGRMPVWSRDPEAYELFYLRPVPGEPGVSALMAASVETESGEVFEYGAPIELFKRRFPAGVASFRSTYDVNFDGSRIITTAVAPVGDGSLQTSEIVIIQNWISQLEDVISAGE